MSTPALLTKEDAKRLTEAATASGCAIVVNCGAKTVTIIPDGHSLKNTILDTAGDDAPLSLKDWRESRAQNKGARRA